MALALDGHSTTSPSGTNSTPISLTTTSSNDVIGVMCYAEANNSAVTPAISGVSGAGTTGWASRKIVSHTGGSGYALSLWFGKAALALTAVSLTVSFSATFDDAVLVAFGISGANSPAPFDTNAVLPVGVQAARNTAPSATISTTNPDCILVSMTGGTNSTLSQVNTPPTGWTLIDAGTNGGGGLFAEGGAGYKVLTAAQNSLVVTWGAAVATGNINDTIPFIVDAITSNAPIVSVPGNRSGMRRELRIR